MSADTLVAALVDHLRNLLIIRTCGSDSELVEVPGISLKDLAAQAERFDAVNLTQDLAILEELRRHMRQSQSGRALLDATLVRLTLAEQFTPVSELLARVGAAPTAVATGDAAQKKNLVSSTVMVNTAAPSHAAPGEVEREITASPAENIAAELKNPPPVAAPPIAAVSSTVPTVSAPPSLDFDDEDDDLPR